MKFFEALITILLCVMVACACVLTYNHFTKQIADKNVAIIPDVNANESKNQVKEKTGNEEQIFSLKDYPKVDASTATQPLANAFIKDFTGEDVNTDKLEYTKTHSAYEKLINGEVDLILVTEPSRDELQLAEDKGIEFEVIPVVKEGFVFFVNEKNKVEDLTLKQIQDIYSGKTTNWKEVGGKNEEIRAFQRPDNSGSQTGMLSLVMKNKEIKKPITEEIAESMQTIVNIVSNYDNGEDAIGYSYYYYVNIMFNDIDSNVKNKIRLLKIDGVEPTFETIKNGDYKLQTSYYIVINKDEPKNSNTRKLVEAMLSDRGQKIAEGIGYVGAE